MKEVLLLNLTRMGDILQKTPAVIGLKERYPDVRITAVVSRAFAAVCRGIPWIDRVYEWDKAELIQTMRDPTRSLIEKAESLQRWVRPLQQNEYDLVMNFTHSRASAILLYLLKAREVRGLSMSPEGHRAIRHPWMRYFFCAVSHRRFNTFNLADMYARGAGVRPSGRTLRLRLLEADEAFAQGYLQKHGVAEGEVLVGLQPGASSTTRCWPADAYAALADRLIREMGVKVILLGSASERGLADAIRAGMREVPIDAVGETATPLQLAALLRRCRALVSPDTGPMHIATAVGTRVISLFLNTAYYPETGPYGDGHYVLHSKISCYPCAFDVECRHRVCQEDIRVEHVLDALGRILRSERPAAPTSPSLWENVVLLESFFDESGLLDYRPVYRIPLSAMDLIRMSYREMWKHRFDAFDHPENGAVERILARIQGRYTLREADRVPASVEGVLLGIQALREQGERGVETAKRIAISALDLPAQSGTVCSMGDRLLEIDAVIEQLGYTHEALHPMITLFSFGRENLNGQEISQMAQEVGTLYEELVDQVRWLDRTLRGVLSGLPEAAKRGSGCGEYGLASMR